MKIGDKVVCVDFTPCRICGAKITLLKNTVYVVEDKRDEPCEMLKLVGVPHPNCHAIITAFKATRFRKLDELKEQTRLKQEIHSYAPRSA